MSLYIITAPEGEYSFLFDKMCTNCKFIPRVLDDSDPDIQEKALDCLLNWKDDYLTPYSQNLKNLINIKTLREEMTTWAVSHDSFSILKDHRSHVVPLVIRVLTPKVRKLKLLGSRKVCVYLLLMYNPHPKKKNPFHSPPHSVSACMCNCSVIARPCMH